MSLTLEVVRPSSLTDDKNIHQLGGNCSLWDGQMEPSAAVQGVWQGVGWSRFAVLWPFWIQ